MEKVIGFENGNVGSLPLNDLYREKIITDDRDFRKKYGRMVKAFAVSHAHLDHLAAIPAVAPQYGDVPIIATPFTVEVLSNLLRERKEKFNNKVIKLNAGSTYRVSKNIEIEFIYATHSTPQTVMIAVHTPVGTLLYANDFKFDEYPSLGRRTDYKRLRELAPLKCLIVDTTRIAKESRTHSESLVKEMLKDVLMWTENKENLIVVTTFASHISRINTIVDIARDMKREPVILGRSMTNYILAAERCGVADISSKAQVWGYKGPMMKILRKIKRDRGKYLLIVTGHQGEPNAVLSKMARSELPFDFKHDDEIVFACEVIPAPVNAANRAHLEKQLKSHGVRIFKDIHVSGHASREDHRDFINILKPETYIPTHGGMDKLGSAIDLAVEMGYKFGENAILLQDGQTLEVK
ncbi:MAG: ribonuclease J [Candidatus Thorarchaeota archaeon]|nr:MAG: ribonuclease J [Candidatus Thorarchaeota archaeon]